MGWNILAGISLSSCRVDGVKVSLHSVTLVPGYFHFQELEQVWGAKAPHRHLLRAILQSLLLLRLVHVCIWFSLVASVCIVGVPVFIFFIDVV